MHDLLRRASFLFVLLGLVAYGCDCGSGAGEGGGGDGGDDDGGGLDATSDASDDPDASGDANVPVRPDVHVVITADNAYGFGYGGSASLTHYFQGVEDGGDKIFVCSDECDDTTPCPDVGGEPVACDPFGTCNDDRWGPETYIVPGENTTASGFLYVITWSDESVTQGLIGQFSASDGSKIIYTGQSPEWRVCATGLDYDPGEGGPSLEVIDEYIEKCNLGAAGGTFSQGWVGPAGNAEGQALVVLDPSEEASHSNFDGLCGRDPLEAGRGDAIGDPARWIWFDDDVDDGLDAFTSTSDDPRGDFLIFRLPLFTIIVPG